MSIARNHNGTAYLHYIPKAPSQFAILWLNGYASVMNSTKASAIAEFAMMQNIEVMRFDYHGLGESTGEFNTGTFSIYLEQALQQYRAIQAPNIIVIGSSMGAWLALRLCESLQQSEKDILPNHLLLIAPAVDFTHEILLKQLPDETLRHFKRSGQLILPSKYDIESLSFTYSFIEDAEQHLLFNRPPNVCSPITMIHGAKDPDIPIALAHKAQHHFNVQNFITIQDGDHRLSREQDIHLILKSIQNIIE